jgi:hypothetical protein
MKLHITACTFEFEQNMTYTFFDMWLEQPTEMMSQKWDTLPQNSSDFMQKLHTINAQNTDILISSDVFQLLCNYWIDDRAIHQFQ